MTENTETEEAKDQQQPETTTEPQPVSYKKELIIGAVVVAIVLVIIGVIILAVYNSEPNVDYEPAVACDAFSSSEAQELLGGGAFRGADDPAVVTKDTAISRCGYTDGTADTNTMVVAAVILRAGVNDKGVAQNKAEFANGTPTVGVEIISNVGDSAYFNQLNGQLNVLKGRNWYILSNGVGSSPEANTVENAVKLAEKVLN